MAVDWSNPFKNGSAVMALGAAGNLAGNMLSNGYSSSAGNALQGISSVASAIPGPWGSIASGALSVLGGGANALFGSKVNQAALNSANADISRLQNFQSNASSFDDIQGPQMFGTIGNVYSGGVFSKKSARRKNNALRQRALAAYDFANRSVENNVNNLQDEQMNSLLANFAAYGGDIHIDSSKRGTFTSAAKKRGMGVQEFASRVLSNKENYSPAMVKKANFARNASKWHSDGGLLDEINNNPFFNIVKFVDPTGISSYYDVYDAGKDLYNNPSWSNAGNLGLEILGAIPLVGKLGKVLKIGSRIIKGDETFKAGAKTLDFLSTRMPSALKDSYDIRKYEEEKKNKNKKKAFGGDLMTNGATWDNGFTYIGNGGSHESNPNEGVQVGVDPQGIPNLVEEGEVIWNDYVFSKRLKVPKSFKDKYKLKSGGPISFADAAKKFTEENKERPNDPISKKGRDALLTTLMDQQEEVRLKKQQREAKDQFNSLNPDEQLGIMQMAQQYAANADPEEQEITSNYPNQLESQYAEGGELGNLFKGTGPKSNRITRKYDLNWFKDRAKALGFDLGDGFKFSPTDYDLNLANFNELYKQHQRQKAYEAYLKNQRSNWENTEFDSKRYKRSDDGKSIYKAKFYDDNDLGKDYIDINGNRISLEEYNRLLSDYNTINSNPKATTEEKNRAAEFIRKAYKNSPVVKGQFAKDYNGNIIYDYSQDVSNTWIPNDNILGKNFKFDDANVLKISYDPNFKRSLSSYLRYTPVLGSAVGVLTDAFGLTNKPDYSAAAAVEAKSSETPRTVSFSPIGDYMTYTPLDRNYYLNQMRSSAAASRRALTNVSGGNRGTAMAGILGSDYNTIGNMGTLARQAEEYNLGQKQGVAGFNRGTNQFNTQGIFQAGKANQAAYMDADKMRFSGIATGAQIRAAEDARVANARSTNLTNFINSLKQIGEEAYDQDKINALIQRGVLKDLYKNSTAYGGMLTKFKRKKGDKK